MTITINGSGTVTGISVGGLPDGIVDTDMIAAAAVTDVKRGPGAILQIVQSGNLSTYGTTSTTYSERLSTTITPKQASSKIIIFLQLFVNNYITNATNSYSRVKVQRDVNSGGDAEVYARAVANKVHHTGSGMGYFGNMCGPIFYTDSPSYSLGNSIDYSLWLASNGGGSEFGSDSHTSYYQLWELAQ